MAFPFIFSDADVRTYGDGEPLIRDAVLTAGGVATLVRAMDGMDAAACFRVAGVGSARTAHPQVRNDRTAWATDSAMPTLHAEFVALRGALNAEAWLGLEAFTVQLAIYDAPGALYAPHRDALAGDPARRTTAILYLNPDWLPEHGGCLRVHPPSGLRDIEPIGGRLVVFRSDRLLHEVLPSFAVRRAATAWFRGRASNPLMNLAQD